MYSPSSFPNSFLLKTALPTCSLDLPHFYVRYILYNPYSFYSTPLLHVRLNLRFYLPILMLKSHPFFILFFFKKSTLFPIPQNVFIFPELFTHQIKIFSVASISILIKPSSTFTDSLSLPNYWFFLTLIKKAALPYLYLFFCIVFLYRFVSINSHLKFFVSYSS